MYHIIRLQGLHRILLDPTTNAIIDRVSLRHKIALESNQGLVLDLHSHVINPARALHAPKNKRTPKLSRQSVVTRCKLPRTTTLSHRKAQVEHIGALHMYPSLKTITRVRDITVVMTVPKAVLLMNQAGVETYRAAPLILRATTAAHPTPRMNTTRVTRALHTFSMTTAILRITLKILRQH